MRNLLPIGRFSELCRLSVPALRHYDELALLKPALVDADTGYRYYSLSQATDADLIKKLRMLEMPLPEIREILAATPERARELIEGHRQRLLGSIEKQRFAIGLLDAMLREGRVTMYDIHLREIQPQLVATIRGTVPWADLGTFVPGCFKELWETCTGQGVRLAGPPFTMYFTGDPESPVELEAGVPISDDVEPSGRVRCSTLPGGLAATTLHAGAYDEVGPAYRALAEWIEEHGHEMKGAPREIYLVGPDQVTDPGALRTEIVWPIG